MREKADIAVCAFIAYMAPRQWARVLFSSGEGKLTSTGLASLKYFTMLSNLFMGLACIIYLVDLFLRRKERYRRVSRGCETLKFSAAVSVMLTFITVRVFLGPLYGYRAMFSGVNFWLHLVIPVLALVDFCFLDREAGLELPSTIACVIPMAVYGIGYTANILINGRGEWPNTNDWYSFAQWGIPVMGVIYVIIFVVTWGISVGMLVLHNYNAEDDPRVHRR